MKKNQAQKESLYKSEIDWEKIIDRVKKQEQMLSQKNNLSKKEKIDLLSSRAKKLAFENKDKEIQNDVVEVIVFRLASETYGIETRYVRELYPLNDYTMLPGLPSFVLGIMNVRGQIISVVDLKKFFNLPQKGLGELNKVIIIQNKKLEFGILADFIEGTYTIPINSIHKTMSDKNHIGSEYLQGVTSEHFIILDGAKILEDEKIIVNQKIQ